MSQTTTMKAVNYQGAFKVKVEEVPMQKSNIQTTLSSRSPLQRSAARIYTCTKAEQAPKPASLLATRTWAL